MSKAAKNIFKQPWLKQHLYEKKPTGLWYAFGAKWLKLIADSKWGVNGEYQNLEYYQGAYKLDVNRNKMIVLTNYNEMLQFTKQYEFTNDIAVFKKELKELKKKDPEGWGDTSLQGYLDYKHDTLVNAKNINWQKVASRYAGIEIAPWIPQAQNNPYVSWYFGWDIASGCIWNRSAINKMTKIKL